MARKPKSTEADEGVEQIQAEAPETGTDRVVTDSGFRIPGPILPKPYDNKAKKSDAPKTATDRTAQNAVTPGIHLDLEQNRLARLRNLARTNRDVRWLLEQHESN